jgi:hypothetical protein
MVAGRARRAAREAMRREFMMAGGPIDVCSRLRRPASSERGWQGERMLSKVPGTSLPLGNHVRGWLSQHNLHHLTSLLMCSSRFRSWNMLFTQANHLIY